MENMRMEEKTIFIRCSAETNDLLEKIRKSEMPPRSRNSQIIYLIHKEAERLGVEPDEVVEQNEPEPAVIKSGLEGLAETMKQDGRR